MNILQKLRYRIKYRKQWSNIRALVDQSNALGRYEQVLCKQCRLMNETNGLVHLNHTRQRELMNKQYSTVLEENRMLHIRIAYLQI